jgi:hypothetical protein
VTTSTPTPTKAAGTAETPGSAARHPGEGGSSADNPQGKTAETETMDTTIAG